MADSLQLPAQNADVPWEAEAWPIIEHEPEHIPVIPPDFDWSTMSVECDRLHCNDTIGRCAECPRNRLGCLEGPDGCRGEVLMRWPGYGDKCWPRCERHGNARLEREEQNIRRNSPDGPGSPWGFDELEAGESWENAA